jgi:CIC family chloride channel protein
MVSNLIAYFIASRLQKVPIYEALAEQDGIHLPTARSRQRHRQRRIASIMRAADMFLPAETTAWDALKRIGASKFQTWLVTDGRGVIGVIDLSRLQREAAESPDKPLGEWLNAGVFPHVHADQGLDLALERMGANQLDILPVVSRADVHRLEGIVALEDVLDAYGVTRN